MKKTKILCCGLALLLTLTACGGRPSDKEIKTALDEGTITVEDAMSKGWIDEEWIEANYEQVEAQTKIHLFAPFETTYLDGTPVSSDIISNTMCLVFFNTAKEGTMEKLAPFEEALAGMEDAGVPLLGVVTDEDLDTARENLKDISFPIIVYNDEMRASMENYGEMTEQDLAAVFTKDGGFYSAWYTDVTADDLVKSAEAFANMDE